MKITVFSGGSGGAKLAHGLLQIAPEVEVTVIVNTGDDFSWYGLPISPDLDTVLYTLAGWASSSTGWGIEGDTFQTLHMLELLGEEPWFHMGDRDLATQLFRQIQLQNHVPLSRITAMLSQRMGIRAAILPMTDASVRTVILSEGKTIPFQEYFVRHRCQDRVDAIQFQGSDQARPAPGVLESIRDADWVLIGPSNPYVSIGAILSIAEIRESLHAQGVKVAAVSPIVSGKAIKGPAAKMLQEQGLEASPASVCRLYADFLDLFVADIRDMQDARVLEETAVPIRFCDTVMPTVGRRRQVAAEILSFLREF